MSSPDVDDLRARLAELEAENARLRAEIVPAAAAPAATPAARTSHRGRSILSAVLIVLALLLAPLSVVASFARTQLTDTDAFVATFAPLADDPAVQATIRDAVVQAINDSVDIAGLTSDVFDGLEQLELPDRATAALQLLEGPAVQGIQSLIQQLVERFVTSDAFSDTWRQALTVTHTQLVATMSNDPDAAVTLSADGVIELNLAPIVAEVRTRLIDSGLQFAERIPEVNRSIVLAESEAARQAQVAYSLVVAVGMWLPFLALAMLAGGVLVAVNHRAALMRAGIGLGVLMLVVWAGIAIGRTVAVGQLSPDVVSASTATVLYDTAVDAITRATIAVGLLGVGIALVALFTGPSRVATQTRSVTTSMAAAIRAAGQRHGLSTGAVGRFVDRYHPVVLGVIAAVVIAVIAFSRPLTPALVVWTAVLAALAVVVVQILRLPDDPAAPSAESAEPVQAVGTESS